MADKKTKQPWRTAIIAVGILIFVIALLIRGCNGCSRTKSEDQIRNETVDRFIEKELANAIISDSLLQELYLKAVPNSRMESEVYQTIASRATDFVHLKELESLEQKKYELMREARNSRMDRSRLLSDTTITVHPDRWSQRFSTNLGEGTSTSTEDRSKVLVRFNGMGQEITFLEWAERILKKGFDRYILAVGQYYFTGKSSVQSVPIRS